MTKKMKQRKKKRLKGGYKGKQQKSDTIHSAPSSKEEESTREGDSNEINETSDDECDVTFKFGGKEKEVGK